MGARYIFQMDGSMIQMNLHRSVSMMQFLVADCVPL